jgi:hypothetical protein
LIDVVDFVTSLYKGFPAGVIAAAAATLRPVAHMVFLESWPFGRERPHSGRWKSLDFLGFYRLFSNLFNRLCAFSLKKIPLALLPEAAAQEQARASLVCRKAKAINGASLIDFVIFR